MINTNKKLTDFLEQIKADKIFAVDTEFLRINTYYPKPCLLQVATGDVAKCVDLLAEIDLKPLFDKLYDGDSLLIFHSGRQDLEIFYNLNDKLPKNIFDTQICASFLGYTHQVAYGDLVRDILGVSLEKKYSRFDWSKRPLPQDVVDYALDDVRYLIKLYHKFKKYEYYDWALQDSSNLLELDLYQINTANACKKVKGIRDLSKKYHSTAIALAGHREEIAIVKNKPRKWIFDDKLLLEYAMGRVKIPSKIKDKLVIIDKQLNKPKPPTNTEKEQIKELEKKILSKSLKYNLTPEIIATKKDILNFIRGKNSKLNNNWRQKIMSDIKLVDAGNVPECVNVVIEIPANASPVKYELDKETNALFVDRFMSAPMFYPANYGFVPQTLADDGDPADVLVITPYPLVHNCVIKARPVGVLKMTDDGGVDAKILAVPFGKLSTEYDDIKDIDDVPELLKQQIEHFFTHYKELEKGKWVKIDGWDNVAKAKEILTESQKAYQK